MAEAKEKGATTIITAAAANRLGLKTHLVLVGEKPETATGNLLVDRLLGVEEIHYVEGDTYGRDSPVEGKVRQLERRLTGEGEVPYYSPTAAGPSMGRWATPAASGRRWTSCTS